MLGFSMSSRETNEKWPMKFWIETDLLTKPGFPEQSTEPDEQNSSKSNSEVGYAKNDVGVLSDLLCGKPTELEISE